MIGGIVVLWTLAAPIAERAVVTHYVVQIAPWVKGKVLRIPAKPNVPLKKAKDMLFEIDPNSVVMLESPIIIELAENFSADAKGILPRAHDHD